MVDPERDPLSGLSRGRFETALAFRTKNDPEAGGAGRSHDGKLLVVGAVEVGDGNAPKACAWPRSRPTAPNSLNRCSSATTSPPPAPPRPTAGPATPRPPSRPTIPTSSVPLPPTSCLPWIHQVFSNLKGWARGVYHGLRAKHLQSYLDEVRVPLQPAPDTPRRLPLAVRHRRVHQALHLQHVGPAGSWCISDSRRRYSIGVVHLRFQINFNEVTVLYATWRFAKSDSMIRISTTLKCRLKAATMPSESLLGIAGDISDSTCTELYSGKWVHTTYSGYVGDNADRQGSRIKNPISQQFIDLKEEFHKARHAHQLL